MIKKVPLRLKVSNSRLQKIQHHAWKIKTSSFSLTNDFLLELKNEKDDLNGKMDFNLILNEENLIPIMKQIEPS